MRRFAMKTDIARHELKDVLIDMQSQMILTLQTLLADGQKLGEPGYESLLGISEGARMRSISALVSLFQRMEGAVPLSSRAQLQICAPVTVPDQGFEVTCTGGRHGGEMVTATVDFKSKYEEQLDFEKGDRIMVVRKYRDKNMWGRIEDENGWRTVSFVVRLCVPDCVVVVCDRESTAKGELSLRKGDEVKVLECNITTKWWGLHGMGKRRLGKGEWWKGEDHKGNMGIFPSSYCRVSRVRVMKKHILCEEGRIDLKRGQVLEVLESREPWRWWVGELRGVKGMFPSDCVE